MSAPIIEPASDVLLTFEAAGRWGAWCFALDPSAAADARPMRVRKDAFARLIKAAHAGRLRTWRPDAEGTAHPVSLDEAARWHEDRPGRVYDEARAMDVDLPGPLLVRWGEARAALAVQLRPRAAAAPAADATDRDAWALPWDALERCKPGVAHLARNDRLIGHGIVAALALNLVTVAERRNGGELVPIVLHPWQAWDLPGADGADQDAMRGAWAALASPDYQVLRAAPWQDEPEGPQPFPSERWRTRQAGAGQFPDAPEGRSATFVPSYPHKWSAQMVPSYPREPGRRDLPPGGDWFVDVPEWRAILLHVPQLLAALRAVLADWAEKAEPVALGMRWRPMTDAVGALDDAARRQAGTPAGLAAIGAAIKAGRLPVALCLPQRNGAGVPPEDVQVPAPLLPCLALANGAEAAAFDWQAAVTIGDAIDADAVTRAAVVNTAPCRRDQAAAATSWEGVGLAVRLDELARVIAAGPGKAPDATHPKRAGTARGGPRMGAAVQRAREALAAKLHAEGCPEVDAPADLVRWFQDQVSAAPGASDANAKRHVGEVVRAHRKAVAADSGLQDRAIPRSRRPPHK